MNVMGFTSESWPLVNTTGAFFFSIRKTYTVYNETTTKGTTMELIAIFGIIAFIAIITVINMSMVDRI